MFRFIWYYASEYIVVISMLALILTAFTVKSCKQRIPGISNVEQLMQHYQFEFQIREYHNGTDANSTPDKIHTIQVKQYSQPIIYYNGAQAPFTPEVKGRLKALLKACISQHNIHNPVDTDAVSTDYRFVSKRKDFIIRPVNCTSCNELNRQLQCSLEFKLPEDQKLQTIYCNTFSEE